MRLVLLPARGNSVLLKWQSKLRAEQGATGALLRFLAENTQSTSERSQLRAQTWTTAGVTDVHTSPANEAVNDNSAFM